MKKINDTKEPWQMTRAEWFDYKFNKLPQKIQKQILGSEKGFASVDEIRRQTDSEHEGMIRQYLSEGKPVPANVLVDYPDLRQAILDKVDNAEKEKEDLEINEVICLCDLESKAY